MRYDPKVRTKALDHIARYGLAPTHKRILHQVNPNSRVLDLGCATGYLSQALQEKKCEVTGVEMDAEAASQAEKFCSQVIVGDAGDAALLQSLPDTFDVIICADIIEHLTDPWSVLRLLATKLLPDGYLLVSLPNVAYWKMRWDLLRGRFVYTDTGLLDQTHLRFFTVKTFKDAISQCGLKLDTMIINDAGFPGFSNPKDWDTLPVPLRWLVTQLPNLCVFHAIYKLRNTSEGVI